MAGVAATIPGVPQVVRPQVAVARVAGAAAARSEVSVAIAHRTQIELRDMVFFLERDVSVCCLSTVLFLDLNF